jgi:hypothetical protein
MEVFSMGYLHINNLYKDQDILLFKECFALEKIHGTSAHLSFNNGELGYFSGGASYEQFKAIFNHDVLSAKFTEKGLEKFIVYGEAYGGKMQGMSKTYGPDLKFAAFDVKVGDTWLSVPMADEFVKSLGLEFVDYHKVSTDLAALDAERDLPSTQAKRNGITEDRIREGVVLRPLIELTNNNGGRIICKHKRSEFSERKSIPEVDPAKREILENAEAIAEEWVTDMRMSHVLDKLGNPHDMSETPKVIVAMIEDVLREANGEIIDSKPTRKAIGHKAAMLYKGLATKIGTQTSTTTGTSPVACRSPSDG